MILVLRGLLKDQNIAWGVGDRSVLVWLCSYWSYSSSTNLRSLK